MMPNCKPECSAMLPWRTECQRIIRCDPSLNGVPSAGRDVERLRHSLLGGGAAIDPARAVVSRAAAASVLLSAKRAAADGAIELQPAVSLVCGPGDRRSE